MALSNAYLKVIKKLFNKSENDLSVIKKEDYVCPVCEHYHIVKYDECEYCGMPKEYLKIKKIKDFLLTGIYPFHETEKKAGKDTYDLSDLLTNKELNLHSNSQENTPIIFLNKNDFSFKYERLVKEILSINFKKIIPQYRSNIGFVVTTMLGLSLALFFSIILKIPNQGIPFIVKYFTAISFIISAVLLLIRSSVIDINHITSHYQDEFLKPIGYKKRLLGEITDTLLENIRDNENDFNDILSLEEQEATQRFIKAFYEQRINWIIKYDKYHLDYLKVDIDRFENYASRPLSIDPKKEDTIELIKKWAQRESNKVSQYKSLASYKLAAPKLSKETTFFKTVDNLVSSGFIDFFSQLNYEVFSSSNWDMLHALNTQLTKWKDCAKDIKNINREYFDYEKSEQEIKTSKASYKRHHTRRMELNKLERNIRTHERLIHKALHRIRVIFFENIDNEEFKQLIKLIVFTTPNDQKKKTDKFLKDFISLIADDERFKASVSEYYGYLCKHDIDAIPPKNNIVEQFETWFNYLKKFNNSKEIVLAREIIRSENLLSNQIANIEEIKQIQIKRIKKIKNDFIIKKKGVKLSENKEVRREINDKYPPHLLEADEDELPLDDFEVENVKQDIEQEILNLELERNQLLNYRTKLKTNNSNI